ncbi:MAG: hypothetical protein HXX20_08930 [Chloroflexi bacterium]|nr:hypothetical protein [Chloroflexota bacterium]
MESNSEQLQAALHAEIVERTILKNAAGGRTGVAYWLHLQDDSAGVNTTLEIVLDDKGSLSIEEVNEEAAELPEALNEVVSGEFSQWEVSAGVVRRAEDEEPEHW